MLELYVYSYINQVPSSRKLEREAGRNVELMWLTGRLAPDFKTIADFRRDHGPAIRAACRQFVALCRRVGLFAHAVARRPHPLLQHGKYWPKGRLQTGFLGVDFSRFRLGLPVERRVSARPQSAKLRDEAMSEAITPFTLAIEQSALDDLNRRLDQTRWPEKETVADWTQGSPLAKVQALCAHWRNGYDWRRAETRLNQLGQFKTEIDGLNIHFLHVRSPHAEAMPLIMTHGWPGSVMEFMKVIGPLTDPTAHGGSAKDAFHVVAPSLPGYGFSEKPTGTGWGVPRIAGAWIQLMARLGYDRWVAQGGDWGSAVTTAIGVIRPPACAAIHVNMPLVFPAAEDIGEPTPFEQAALASLAYYQEKDSGYSKQQSTRPQSLGYGLVDSPAGQAAWIYEKLWAWTDNKGAPEDVLTPDEMLDNIMLYWLPATGASSARLYWESFGSFASIQLELPVGVSVYPKEIFRASRRWAEKRMSNIIHWSELDRGGHFAAWEQPEIFVKEIRSCFAKVR